MHSLEQLKNDEQVVYIFCESYVQLDNTIRVIEQNISRNKNSIVFLGTESLYNLFVNIICTEYKNVRVVKFYQIDIQIDSINILGKIIKLFVVNIKRMFFLSNIYREYFEKLNEVDVYLFCRNYNPNTYYIIKRIIGCNRIHFIESRDYEDDVNLEIIKLTNIRYIIKNILLKLVFGRGINYVKFAHGSLAPQIDSKIYDKCFEYIPAHGRQKWLDEFPFNEKLYAARQYDVIFYDFGDEIFNYITDRDHYNAVIRDVFSIIGRYFKSNKICVKYHPTFKPATELEQYGIVAPNYIPGEWYQKDTVFLLGIFSTCVYNAKKGYPVSLANLFKYENKDIKDNFIAATLNRELEGSKVLIPNCLEELDQIIKSSLTTKSTVTITSSNNCYNGYSL